MLLSSAGGLLVIALLLSGCAQTSSSPRVTAKLTKAEVLRIDMLQDPYLNDVQAMDLPLRKLDMALGSLAPTQLAALARPAQLALRVVSRQLKGLAHRAPQALDADLMEESRALSSEAVQIEAIAIARSHSQLTRAIAGYRRASALTGRITATTQQALEIVGQG